MEKVDITLFTFCVYLLPGVCDLHLFLLSGGIMIKALSAQNNSRFSGHIRLTGVVGRKMESEMESVHLHM